MFQAGGLVVVLVEVVRKAYLASIVPVIVNAVLHSHQVVVDIVAFVSKGDFPRSRLGEKQRGKILASWVTRKMRTIAQFSIRDGDGADSQITEVAEPITRLGSVVGVGSSLRNVENVTSPPAAELQSGDYTSLPTGISEMPANYESSIVESPPLPSAAEDRNETPTNSQSARREQYPVEADYSYQYHGVDDSAPRLSSQSQPDAPSSEPQARYQPHAMDSHYSQYDEEADDTPQTAHPEHSFDFSPETTPPSARYASKPVLASSETQPPESGGLSSLPSQKRYSSANYTGHYSNGVGGGLRVANNAGTDSSDETDDWRSEALMQMNLAKEGSRTASREGNPGDRGGGVYDNYAVGGYGHAL